MTLPSGSWLFILCVGIVLAAALVLLKGMPRSLWVVAGVVVWTVGLVVTKTYLGVPDAWQPGMVWIVVFFISYFIPSHVMKKILLVGIVYFSLVNLTFSVPQVVEGYANLERVRAQVSAPVLVPEVDHMPGPPWVPPVPLAAYQGQAVGYASPRASGVFNTPLALGCFGVFAVFAFLALMPRKGISLLAALPIISLLFLPMAKSSIAIAAAIFFMLIANSIMHGNIRKYKYLIYTVLLLVSVVSLWCYGFVTGVHSAYYKPLALIYAVVAIISTPLTWVVGDLGGTVQIFKEAMTQHFGTGNLSYESWLLRLIPFYGLPYFLVFVWLLLKPIWISRYWPNAGYIAAALFGILLAALVSNGGAQPPISFFLFGFIGYIFSKHAETVSNPSIKARAEDSPAAVRG